MPQSITTDYGESTILAAKEYTDIDRAIYWSKRSLQNLQDMVVAIRLGQPQAADDYLVAAEECADMALYTAQKMRGGK